MTAPGYRVFTHTERPELRARWSELIAPAWPELMLHDAVCNRYWRCLTERFPDGQFYLCDESTGAVLGVGNTVPVAWDGTIAGLPGGVDDMLIRAFGVDVPAVPPTTLSALQAVVMGEQRGRGLSYAIIREMGAVARRHGFDSLIAPVRPTWKSRYPLTPMDRYMRWEREDGQPLDPWLRVHRRLGAEIMAVADESMVVTGTVTEWERWTGLPFPESGPYVVPGALVPVAIDLERDEGRYTEPNVWMRHPLT
jgi:GNAT superfamily N-acetyltransferase